MPARPGAGGVPAGRRQREERLPRHQPGDPAADGRGQRRHHVAADAGGEAAGAAVDGHPSAAVSPARRRAGESRWCGGAVRRWGNSSSSWPRIPRAAGSAAARRRTSRRPLAERARGRAMSLRTWVVLRWLSSSLGWWYSPLSPRVPRSRRRAAPGQLRCPRRHASHPAANRPCKVAGARRPCDSARAADAAAARGFQPRCARAVARGLQPRARSGAVADRSRARLGPACATTTCSIASTSASPSRWYHYRWQGSRRCPRCGNRTVQRQHAHDPVGRSLRPRHCTRPRWASACASTAGWSKPTRRTAGAGAVRFTRRTRAAGACEVVYVCSLTLLL